MSQISKATQSSESDTDFIQDNTINSVYGDSLGSENDTPAKAKRGLNKIYLKYKEYRILKHQKLRDLVWFTDDLLTINMINMNATDKIKKEKQENQVAIKKI